jgi:hypothetical protein
VKPVPLTYRGSPYCLTAKLLVTGMFDVNLMREVL